MAIVNFSQWSVTPTLNTDIGNVTLLENVMRPSNVNNAFQTMMSQLKLGVPGLNTDGGVTLTYVDAGSAFGPVLTLFRDSASPAALDGLGFIEFRGRNSAGNAKEYSAIGASPADPTSASEDGRLNFYNAVNGTRTVVAALVGGLFMPGTTDPGAGNIAAARVYAGTGTLALPALSFQGDPDSGFWEDTTGRISIAVDGAYIGYWNSTGWTLTGSAPGVAATFGSVDAVKNLLSGGGQIDVTNTTGGTALRLSRTTDGALASFHRAATLTGSISGTASATAFNTSSDQWIKEHFKAFSAGEILDDINMYQFNFIAAYGGELGYGAKAQELDGVFPIAVTPGNDLALDDPDFRPWQVDYSKLVPLLVQEVKDLRQRLSAAGL